MMPLKSMRMHYLSLENSRNRKCHIYEFWNLNVNGLLHYTFHGIFSLECYLWSVIQTKLYILTTLVFILLGAWSILYYMLSSIVNIILHHFTYCRHDCSGIYRLC